MTSAQIVYECKNNVLVSFFRDGVLEKAWTEWKPRYIQIRDNATFVYRKKIDSADKALLDISKIRLNGTFMDDEVWKESGVKGTMVTMECSCNKLPTKIRFIVSHGELEIICKALRTATADHNIDDFLEEQRVLFASVDDYRRSFSVGQRERQESSVMRRAITVRVRQFDKRTRNECIEAKRGIWKWLPVHFSNDLVHGSVWYVVASIISVGIGLTVLLGKLTKTNALEEDDTQFTNTSYEAQWALIVFSGLFFTLGSFAFLRAMNDPPMPSLLPAWAPHLHTDELAGAWCFVMACLPFIPFSCIYLVINHYHYMYWCMVFMSFLAVFVAFLFVFNCYPTSATDKPSIIVPLLKCITCDCICFSSRFVDRHCGNDWLACTWVVFMATALGVVMTAGLLVEDLLFNHNTILHFINAASFLDTVLFLVGSAYFVAGSYDDSDEAAGTVDNSLEGNDKVALAEGGYAGGKIPPYTSNPVIPSNDSNDRDSVVSPMSFSSIGPSS